MSRWWCCCGGPCWSVEDNFNRPDSTDIGDAWVVESGSAEIRSNRLWLDAASLVRTSQRHPKVTTTCLASVILPDVQQNVAYTLIVNYTDADNYLGATYLHDGTTAHLSIFKRVEGVETELDASSYEQALSSYVELWVCRNLSGFEAEAGGLGVWTCLDNESMPAGRRAGLRTTDSEAVFDDFSFSEHYATNTDCPRCYCDCEDYCVPKTLHAMFTAEGTCAACLDGVSVEATTGGGDLAAEVFSKQWDFEHVVEASEECPAEECEGALGTYAFSLLCDRVVGWSLIDWGEPIQATCSPFYLKFGPFDREDAFGQTVVTYYIDITE